jgi:hypothetical protein
MRALGADGVPRLVACDADGDEVSSHESRDTDDHPHRRPSKGGASLERVRPCGSYDRAVPDRIVSLVPAEAGWRAFYGSDEDYESESARVVAWALVVDELGALRVVGLVVGGDDQTAIVPAPQGASEFAPTFERYGFKND